MDFRYARQWKIHNGGMLKKINLLLFSLMIFIFFISSSGFSHPLGNFSINRYSRLEPGADYLSIFYVVDMAEIPTFQEKSSIDTDEDGRIDDRESANYLARKATELPQGLSVLINKQPAQLEVLSKDIVITSEPLFLPTLRIELALRTPLLTSSSPIEITYQDNNYSQRLGWKEIIAKAGSRMEIRESTVPAADVSNALTAYPEEMLNNPPDVQNARIIVASGSGPKLASEDRLTSTAETSRQDRFTRLIQTKDLTARTYIIALLISIGLGAMHALSPGHGKSIVAAYLIGTRGTVKHAVFLGATVTLTHTVGVFALGFITLFASRYILPETLYPWLSLLSGIIVVIIGATMIVKRIRAARNQTGSHHHFIHAHSHNDHGDRSHNNPGHGHHHYNDGDHHDNSHNHHSSAGMTDHTHSHHHPHDNHDHEGLASGLDHRETKKQTLFHHHHNDDHDHSHSHLPPGAGGEPVTWRSLLALGITGGILPCPSALVVLLAAISMHRVGFGMVLILAFSIGLAAVLTTIGLMFVKARQLLDRVPTAGPLMRILPAVSAFIIMILGIGISIGALAQF
ncbi:MAG: sulfite exporter TauE/SafE family protein [Desulfobacterales bacterium]|jgi:ABC-type nickel/cobalt efflux system permease component RcnA